MDPNIALGDPAEQVVQWAEALCTTETALPAEIAAALGADLAGVPRVGSGIMCRPPPEASWLQLVIGRDEQQVQFVEYEPAVELELERLTLLLGPYREPPRGPHESEPTVIFEEIRPERGPRGCTVMARLAADSFGSEFVRTVTLYLQSREDST